jgi:opacity protein-like surface antigen
MYTSRDFSTVTGSVSSISGMVNAKYTMDVSDSIALYGAAGIGYISYTDSGFSPTATNGGFGYQLIGGAAFKVAEKISVLGEVRYQNTFSAVGVPNTALTMSTPTTTVLAGVKLGF